MAGSAGKPATAHRFKVEGDGRTKQYRCTCGNWAMSGSERWAKQMRSQWEVHAGKGGLSTAAGEVQTPEGNPGDSGSSGSGSDSGQ